MKTQEYGEIMVLFPGEKISDGIVLRQGKEKSVVLEQHYGEKNVDVLHLFEFCNLHNKEDFVDCIRIARQYEGNLDIPIYISAEKRVSVPAEVGKVKSHKDPKAECMKCMLDWNLRHPWSMSTPIEKCEKCLKHKTSE